MKTLLVVIMNVAMLISTAFGAENDGHLLAYSKSKAYGHKTLHVECFERVEDICHKFDMFYSIDGVEKERRSFKVGGHTTVDYRTEGAYSEGESLTATILYPFKLTTLNFVYYYNSGGNALSKFLFVPAALADLVIIPGSILALPIGLVFDGLTIVPAEMKRKRMIRYLKNFLVKQGKVKTVKFRLDKNFTLLAKKLF